MKDEGKLEALLVATAELLQAGFPVYEHEDEVVEYAVPAPCFVRAVECFADLQGYAKIKKPEQSLEVDHGCND